MMQNDCHIVWHFVGQEGWQMSTGLWLVGSHLTCTPHSPVACTCLTDWGAGMGGEERRWGGGGGGGEGGRGGGGGGGK